jgi:hypothetical protein
MSTQSHTHPEKVKITIECTLDERTYIKILAAKSHLGLSEFLLSYVRPDFPRERKLKKRKPNKETLESIQELKECRGIKCESIDDFWDKMGMNPHA